VFVAGDVRPTSRFMAHCAVRVRLFACGAERRRSTTSCRRRVGRKRDGVAHRDIVSQARPRLVTLDFNYAGSLRDRMPGASRTLHSGAVTLREALIEGSACLRIEIAPCAGDRHFSAWELGHPRPQKLEPVLDIHVRRAGQEFCPKHDLDLALADGDEVLFCMVIC
jgi:hypothetical protein